jgi:protein TonB
MQTQRMPAASSQPRLVTIGLVAAVHGVAIYALVMALNPAFTLQPRPDTPIDIVPTPTTPPPIVPPVIRPTLVTPDARQPAPQVPKIDTSIPGDTTPTPPPQGVGVGAQPSPHPVAPVVTPARAIPGTHTTPHYPPLAARLSQQGSVRLSLSIDEQGSVTQATVVTSSGYETLDEAAIAWVKAHWRFTPALRNGTPVPASADAIVTFRLTNRQG